MFFWPLAFSAAAKWLQSCPNLCDPIDSSLQGSPVPGILQARTLEWLPFPSPMHESEKWKWSRSVVSDSLQPHGLQPTRFLHTWDFLGKSTGVGCHCLLYNPANVGNLISSSSSFSEPSLDSWKFLIHIMLKPSMQDFKHDFPSMEDEYNCPMVSTFFGTTLLGSWDENWPFPVWKRLLGLPDLLT